MSKTTNTKQVAVIEKTTAVAEITTGAVAAIGKWQEEEAAAFRDFASFVKGEFHHGADKQIIPLGTHVVPNMAELRAGWILWRNGEVVEQRLGLVGNGEDVRRDDLGDQDEAKWVRDDDGNPQDPWKRIRTLPFKNVESGEQFTFQTSSFGGNKALVRFVGHWHRQVRNNPGKLPIMELGATKMPTKKYGLVDAPVFALVAWKSEKELVAGEQVELLFDDPVGDVAAA